MKETIKVLRGLILDMAAVTGNGHCGTALSLAPLGWLLYGKVMRHRPSQPDWHERDRLILSNGHAAALLYGCLYFSGYELTLDDLKRFRLLGSRTPGHPETWMTPGVDMSTGPLGQGVASAVGFALAARHLGRENYTYVICSDGDLMEGITSEAASLATHLKLGRLIVFWDDNHMTIDGPLDESSSEDTYARFEAYGWHVQREVDGEDLDALSQSVQMAKESNLPSFIGVRTIIGYPAPNLQNKPEAHCPAFPADEIRATKEILGLPSEQTFFVPEALRPKATAATQKRSAGALPALEFPVFEPGTSLATRASSGTVLSSLHKQWSNLIGGSADLAGSTKTKDGQIRFGVREHAMAATVLGATVYGGILAYGATYFAFYDYMKPAIRLAALMTQPTIYIFSHDSIGLGPDGPTHQPVEQLASLRATPNVVELRPCDAKEVVGCWKYLTRFDRGPGVLVLSRQNLDTLVQTQTDKVSLGGYILEDCNSPRVTLVGTGSEVHLCLAAQVLLTQRGIAARVVSMPSMSLFAEQSADYQQKVLGNCPRLAVEAASSVGWYRWCDATVCMDQFGASGAGDELMKLNGFTAGNVADVAERMLGSVRTTPEAAVETTNL